ASGRHASASCTRPDSATEVACANRRDGGCDHPVSMIGYVLRRLKIGIGRERLVPRAITATHDGTALTWADAGILDSSPDGRRDERRPADRHRDLPRHQSGREAELARVPLWRR